MASEHGQPGYGQRAVGSAQGRWRAWRGYLAASALVAAATLIGWPVHLWVEPTNLVMLYLTVVVVAALYLGRGPAILASVAGVLAFDFFMVPPRLTLAVADTQYALTFAGLLVVGLVVSALAARAREEVETSRRREQQVAALYALSRDLAGTSSLEGVVEAVVAHARGTFGRMAAVLLPGTEGLEPVAAGVGPELGPEDLALASWVLQHRTAAGEGTQALPHASLRFLPLATDRGIVGVLVTRPTGASLGDAASEQGRLLEAFTSQAAAAVERVQLAEQVRDVELLSATEKLQTALLNSISHDLRTPLASITGVLSSLRHTEAASAPGMTLDDRTRDDLVETAWAEADRLNRFVGNLLDMTRLEAGALKVAKEPCEFTDVVGTVLAQLQDRTAGREIRVDVPADVPMVPMDFVLIAQVLANLLDNALKYSPDGTPIEIVARVAAGCLEVSLADRGAGIPTGEIDRVFDKFHRAHDTAGVSGTGLGLAISRGIVEAHGGTIEAANRPGGGTTIQLRLLLSGGEPPAEEAAQ
jgi:two-component system sensor histidine kinase KdpD